MKIKNLEQICRCCNKAVVAAGESCPVCDWVDDPDAVEFDDFSQLNGSSAHDAQDDFFGGE